MGSGSPWAPSSPHPDKLCINLWGEAAIGMTGMDFETCVRCQIPIMSILSNNFGMADRIRDDEAVHPKYNSTDISGNYADFARAWAVTASA